MALNGSKREQPASSLEILRTFKTQCHLIMQAFNQQFDSLSIYIDVRLLTLCIILEHLNGFTLYIKLIIIKYFIW